MDHIVERAETKSRARAYLLILLAIALIANEWMIFGESRISRILPWFFLIFLTALNLSAFPMRLTRRLSPRLASILDDETTRKHRLKSLGTGFWMSITAALAIVMIAVFQPISGLDSARILVTISLASALITFSTLELKALR